MWRYRGQKRPDFALVPKPGQESVWDYPRPPELVSDSRLVEAYAGDRLIASSHSTYRVLETAHPPSFYMPPKDVDWQSLSAAAGNSVCEWKGLAQYWTLSGDPLAKVIGWSYPDPNPAFEKIRDYISFYPSILLCFVAGEWVRPNAINLTDIPRLFCFSGFPV